MIKSFVGELGVSYEVPGGRSLTIQALYVAVAGDTPVGGVRLDLEIED